MEYSIYVLLIPMVMFLFLGLFQGQLKGRSAGLIGTAGLAVTAVLAYWAAFDYFFVDGKGADGVYQKITEYNWVWLRFTENLHIDLGVLLDPISCMMLVVITTVSLMVHIYSLGYMKGERGFARYYAFLSLFSFSMLGLVVATNIFQMYIFWELVGVSSYLLIGFYYTRPGGHCRFEESLYRYPLCDLASAGYSGIVLLCPVVQLHRPDRSGRHGAFFGSRSQLPGCFGGSLGAEPDLYRRCR